MRSKQFTVKLLMIVVANTAVFMAVFRVTNLWMTPKMRHNRAALDINLGLKALDSGQLANARRYFEDAIRVEPGSHDAYALLAHTVSLQGDGIQAYHLLGRAIDAATSANLRGVVIPHLHIKRAGILLSLSRQRESEALQFCHLALDELKIASKCAEGNAGRPAFLVQNLSKLKARVDELGAKEKYLGIAEKSDYTNIKLELQSYIYSINVTKLPEIDLAE